MEVKPLRFIDDKITVTFDTPPLYEKKPGCPDSFTWEGTTYRVVKLLSEWHDYRRRGRMAHNMRESHSTAASRRGSWGVGRNYFRVSVHTGQVFELYYDRAPGSIEDRKGYWVLYREVALPAAPHA